jgi:hypothetical protein
MPLLAAHFGVVGLVIAGGAAGVWVLSRFHRPLSIREGARSIGRTLTWFSLTLAVCGWAAYPRLCRAAGQADARQAALGAMIGLAVAAVAVRTGARLEQLRLEKGTGTPASAMAARASFFFLALTIVAGVTLHGKARFPVVASLCGLWVPAMLLWRKNPQAGPMEPAASTAWRATFFGLAVTALSSIVIAAFQECAGSGWMTRGLWSGVGGSTVLLVLAGWIATRLAPGQAIAATGLLCGVAGTLLLWL